MEYLKSLLEKSPDAKQMPEIWIIDEYVEKYSSIVDNEINKNDDSRDWIKCSWEKIKITKDLEIYKSTLATIWINSASLSIYIPSRKNSYTLYFNYNLDKFKWNYSENDEWTWLRIDNLTIDFNKFEIFNKDNHKWEKMWRLSKPFYYEILWIKKIMYKMIFNNHEYNKHLIINN